MPERHEPVETADRLGPQHFPQQYRHDHAPVVDANQVLSEHLTLGQRIADAVACIVGSWWFIIIQSVVLFAWAVFNIIGWVRHWDPYPFILMNLFLSCQAAYTAPILMMSQNRQAMRDRLEAHIDFKVNEKAEQEIRLIMEHLEAQDRALVRLHDDIVQLLRQRGAG